MARLYIAEKPSLAKDVMAVFEARPSRTGPAYKLGEDFFVPLQGHVLGQALPDFYLPDDVPLNRNGNKIWRASDLPVIPSTWILEPQKQHAPILEAIRRLLTNVDEVVHLGDPDAEGQLLVDEVLDYLGNTLPVKRLLVNNNNPNEVRKALANLRDNDEPEFRAWYRWALARSRYDWLFGLNLTRAATCRAQALGFDSVLSVGSVQTPALQIVFERDDRIERFTKTSYFLLSVQLQHATGVFNAKWRAADDQVGLDEAGRLVDPDVAAVLAQSMRNVPASVSAFERKPARDLAPLPLSMNELTVEACRRFGCTAAEVLDAAQELYDRYKLTTYPRSENRYLAEAQHETASEALAAIAANRVDLAPLVDRADPTLRSRAFDDKQMVGTPHHGIIPTGRCMELSALKPLEHQVYDLIVRYYLVQFYPAATFMQTSIEVACAGHRLIAGGRTPVASGWLVVLKPSEPEVGEDVQTLPELSVGDQLLVLDVDLQAKETRPPERFDDATLIAAMIDLHKYTDDPAAKARLKEGKGIGTSATRPGIIAELRERGFLVPVKGSKTRFMTSPTGRALLAALPGPVKDPTVAGMFKIALDAVADGEMSFDAFMRRSEQMVTRIVSVIGTTEMNLPNLHACPVCKAGKLRRIKGPEGFFWGCSNYKAETPCKASYQDANGAPNLAPKRKKQRGGFGMSNWF
ncbi:DNA topoisomerase [Burkholderia cepacia]|uniref:DNA topoisomerase n=1 Tax=Burkholderia cepacia TaxID=292 RepID=A0A2S8I7T6_BURCE|nr:DNA topoisomerase [Burkholderia cepacia]PQP10856.1 DNA topoisomerase [Burkholderia cepacia]HDR9511078.1 DNA topoisomerase [Burkholderia cepacia]